MTDLARPLARVLYEAHARSRKLKTKWGDLGPEEKGHWLYVATAAAAFWGDYAEAVEEEMIG